MGKHTEGPWEIDSNNTHAGQIATIHGVTDEFGDPAWLEIWSANWPDAKAQSANAKLMLASPELLDAIDGLLFAINFNDDSKPHPMEEMVAKAHAAISKAMGE